MVIAITIVHVLVCLFLIIVVLLQSGKAADLAGAFGGMGSQTAFGPRGSATVLSKATTIAAALFMVTSLSLSILHTRQGGGAGSSVLDSTKLPAAPAAPATPAPAQPGQPVGAGQQTQLPLPTPITVETEGGKKTQLPVQAPAKQAPAPAAPAKK
jgi:preprotein translocase subunit SecG